MSRLLIFGAGGHGRVIAEIAIKLGRWDEISFLDDDTSLAQVAGIPVIGKLHDYHSFKSKYGNALIAIGNNSLRLKWVNELNKARFMLPVLKHPSSVVSESCRLGQGTVVMAGAVINANAEIGDGCIINTSSSIDHDCKLSDGVHISPGVHLGGTVHIGTGTWVCIGANIANNINIGSQVVVAAGAVVINDILDSIMVAGVPAIKIKELS